MYIVIAPIQVKPEFKARYIESLKGNAGTTVSAESGCVRFEAIQDARDPNRVWLYEVYVDEAAFERHLKAPHFLAHIERARAWTEVLPHGSGRGASNIWPPDEEWE